MASQRVFGFRERQPVNWFSRNLAESNRHCPYCGRIVGEGSEVESNKEHMLARRFVPPGSLGGTDFNFIFRACVSCNRSKSDAERHVSTVTLFTSPTRAKDERVDKAARRKASKDYHPGQPGTLVQDSAPDWDLKGKFAGADITVGMTGPPQLEPSHVELLAFNQVQALFTLITSSDPRESNETRLLPAAHWHPFGYFPCRDWGNVQLQEVCRRVAQWPDLAEIRTASGHFKALCRRNEHGAGDWFWALEWNSSVRVVGAIAAPAEVPAILQDLPEHKWIRLSETHRMREEIPIEPTNDSLFRPE